MADIIPGLKLIKHSGVCDNADDPALPFKLTLNFRAPELCAVAWAFRHGGSETIVVCDSVPCTLRVRDRVRVENPPDDVKVEADLVREKFAADVKDALTKLRPAIAAVEDVLAKKALTNADRETARRALAQFERLIGDTAPFMLDQFEEATQRITTTAKTEIDAFMTSVIVAAGLKAINERGLDAVPPEMRPALPAPQETP